MEAFVDTYGRRRHKDDTLVTSYAVPVLQRRVKTLDGVELDTLRMGAAPDRGVVVCHGFAGNKNTVNLVALAEDLSRFYTVYTFDFRGHGLSQGRSTFGYLEVMDLDAVLALAREDGNGFIGVIGFSMGGIALIRYAAFCRGLDSLIAVGVPADVRMACAPGSYTLRLMLGNPLGRALVRRLFNVRLDWIWRLAATPAYAVPLVAPQPLTIIQGKDDYIFEPDQARELYRLAGGEARLKLYDDFGHADEGYNHLFLRYVNSVLQEDLERGS